MLSNYETIGLSFTIECYSCLYDRSIFLFGILIPKQVYTTYIDKERRTCFTARNSLTFVKILAFIP